MRRDGLMLTASRAGFRPHTIHDTGTSIRRFKDSGDDRP